MYKKFTWLAASGYNTFTTLDVAKRIDYTMYDYIKSVWNTPNSARSPYKYFGGRLTPIGVDDDNNVVYALKDYSESVEENPDDNI